MSSTMSDNRVQVNRPLYLQPFDAMADKRVKLCGTTGEEAKNSKRDVGVDRISKLPDAVIHHILSLVPTVDAVRTSLLSKHWRRKWQYVPTLEFPHEVGFEQENAFSVFVERCLKQRRKAMRFPDGSSVTSLALEVDSDENPKLLPGLSKWLGSNSIMENMKKLDISLHPLDHWFYPEEQTDEPYILPSAVLNAGSLTHVELTGYLEIDSSCSVNLPSLKSLCLVGIRIDTETLQNLIIGCPSLKECFMDQFFDTMDDIRISSVSLRSLQIIAVCENVVIKASNLRYLNLSCGRTAKLDFSECRAIRNLEVSEVFFYTAYLEEQIPKLHLLESLTLCTYENLDAEQAFEMMKISSESLKHIYFNKWHKEELKLIIDAPNLDSFTNGGDIKLTVSLIGDTGSSGGPAIYRSHIFCYIKDISVTRASLPSWRPQ